MPGHCALRWKTSIDFPSQFYLKWHLNVEKRFQIFLKPFFTIESPFQYFLKCLFNGEKLFQEKWRWVSPLKNGFKKIRNDFSTFKCHFKYS